ncbi:MAG: TetR/AcrR family transcriptional regulator [Myxococcota bacterium]
MRTSAAETRARILEAARELLRATAGVDFTLADVGAKLGISRPAVLYHFGTKERLLLELAWEAIAEEADAGVAAVAGAPSAAEAIARFVRGIVAFHRDDLARFALVYAVVQVRRDLRLDAREGGENAVRAYPVTGRMYGAVEAALLADPAWPRDRSARRAAVAAHLAALGVVTMAGMLAAVGDAMREDLDRYVDELVAMLTRGVG